MSSAKITSLLKLTQEAGIALEAEQAAKLVAKYPGKQARSIFKLEFAEQGKPTKAKQAAKPAATASKTQANAATAKTLEPKTKAAANTSASQPSKAQPAHTFPTLTPSKTYRSIAECREGKINPKPLVLQYSGTNMEEFNIQVALMLHALNDLEFSSLYRYLHPATSLIYGSEDYKNTFKKSQTWRRDHLTPREYFDDQTTDENTLARKKRYYLTAKKLSAFIAGTSLKGPMCPIDIGLHRVEEVGQKLFENFDEVGFNAEQWVEHLVTKSSNYTELQCTLKLAYLYFANILAKNSLKDFHYAADVNDLEHKAYSFWMYNLLERHQLLGESEQRYYRKPIIPKQGWKKFKEAGHKVLFYFDRVKVKDYSVNAILAYSTETDSLLDYVLMPADARFAQYLQLLMAKLNLTDLSFCGFFANGLAFDVQELEFFNQVGIEYLIQLYPFIVGYPGYYQWTLDLAKPIYEQIRPVVANDDVLLAAQALTKAEYDSGEYKVNPDLSWLNKPLSELTLADTRPELQTQEKPFCYITSYHRLEDTHLQEQWHQLVATANEVDRANPAALVELKNNPFFQIQGDKLVLDYRDFSQLTRHVFVTNIGRGNFFPKKLGQDIPTAAQCFLELTSRFQMNYLSQAFKLDETIFEFAAQQEFGPDEEITYERVKELFPELFYHSLVTGKYYGEEEYLRMLAAFAEVYGLLD